MLRSCLKSFCYYYLNRKSLLLLLPEQKIFVVIITWTENLCCYYYLNRKSFVVIITWTENLCCYYYLNRKSFVVIITWTENLCCYYYLNRKSFWNEKYSMQQCRTTNLKDSNLNDSWTARSVLSRPCIVSQTANSMALCDLRKQVGQLNWHMIVKTCNDWFPFSNCQVCDPFYTGRANEARASIRAPVTLSAPLPIGCVYLRAGGGGVYLWAGGGAVLRYDRRNRNIKGIN